MSDDPIDKGWTLTRMDSGLYLAGYEFRAPIYSTHVWMEMKSLLEQPFHPPDTCTDPIESWCYRCIDPRPSEGAVSRKMKESKCRSCGERIIWMKTKNDKNIPVDAETVEVGDELIFDNKRHTAHFASCKHADEHRSQT